MKTFLAALLVVAGTGLASDYIFGGPVFKTDGTLLINTSAAAANTSPNVRLPGQGEDDAESQ